MTSHYLAVDGLTVERGGRIVLQDLGFALAAGETILVAGRNGAGKSTLLRTLAGLLHPSAGTIRYGLASNEVGGAETAHYLGYEDALKPSLTVRENLDFWGAMLGRSSSAKRAEPSRGPRPRSGEGCLAEGRGTTRSMMEGAAAASPGGTEARQPPPPPSAVPLPSAKHPSPLRGRGPLLGSARFAGEDLAPSDALAAYGMARLIDLPAAYLSAGQKRRVALARLLLAHRPIWLLDEPLIALDTAAQATVVALMEAHARAGGAILVASHQPLAATRTLNLDASA